VARKHISQHTTSQQSSTPANLAHILAVVERLRARGRPPPAAKLGVVCGLECRLRATMLRCTRRHTLDACRRMHRLYVARLFKEVIVAMPRISY